MSAIHSQLPPVRSGSQYVQQYNHLVDAAKILKGTGADKGYTCDNKDTVLANFNEGLLVANLPLGSVSLSNGSGRPVPGPQDSKEIRFIKDENTLTVTENAEFSPTGTRSIVSGSERTLKIDLQSGSIVGSVNSVYDPISAGWNVTQIGTAP